MREYIQAEHKDKKKAPFDLTGWRDYFSDSTPQQENGYDCGVFAAQTLEQLSRRDPKEPFPPPLSHSAETGAGAVAEDEEDDQEWNFSQENMPYLRRRMAFEIANKKLLD